MGANKFVCLDTGRDAELRLFCFPYAGGSELAFRQWGRELPGSVEAYAALLPGRGQRLEEAPVTQVQALVEEMSAAILPYLDRPFVFFGHSMGATIAFELACLLRTEQGLEATRLLVSARNAPHIPDRKPPTYALPDREFLEELRRLNGTPKEVLEHRELLEFVMPILRADFQMIQTYRYSRKPPLSMPIIAYGGSQDSEVRKEDLAAWSEHTTGEFALRLFDGDHFFIHSEQRRVLNEVAAVLSEIVEGSGRRSEDRTLRPIGVEAESGERRHLVDLQCGEWSLWRWVALRGAGFPAKEVLALARLEAAEAADRVLDAEEEETELRRRALGSVDRELDRLRRDGLWTDRSRRAPLLKALKKLSQGKVAVAGSLPAGTAAALECLRLASERRKTVEAALDGVFSRAERTTSGAIREIAGGERFREAVLWQNRPAYRTCLRTLAETSPQEADRNSRRRQHEEMVASYMQRYAVKNDTIGFFGPVGWARFSAAVDDLIVECDDELVVERNVYLEPWCVERLAQSLQEIPGIREWLAPRLMPFVRLEGSQLHVPTKGSIELGPDQAAILAACDGERSAGDIAAELVDLPATEVEHENEVFEFLELMEGGGVVAWGLEVPLSLHPEDHLHRQLERIGSESTRRRAMSSLCELQDARDAVARASGDADRLDAALGHLESTFVRLTGDAPARAHGETYAARTVVFEDCRRGTRLQLGAGIVRSLAPALELLLSSARWLTHAAAQEYRAAFRRLYEQLASENGEGEIELVTFWARAHDLLADGDRSPAAGIARQFRQKWMKILGLGESLEGGGRRQLQYTVAQLSPSIAEAFAAPRPGWRAALHHSPDVLLAASDVDAVRRGKYYFVLGELHVGLNTIGQNLFVAQHPAPEELTEAARGDLPSGLVSSAISPQNTYLRSARLMPALPAENNYCVQFDPGPVDTPPSRTLMAAELLVVPNGVDLAIRSRDGSLRFDVLDVASDFFRLTVADTFEMFSELRHAPRITIDRLVMSRECWKLPLVECSAIHETSSARRFVAARRWARREGLPRFVFVKLPSEEKPFYVDFASPVFVDIFVRLTRGALEGWPEGFMRVTEMLPAHGEFWLPDAGGRLYTSELRMVAVDQSSRSAAD